MKIYLCDDGNIEVEIEAGSAREAAHKYVTEFARGDRPEIKWIDVYVGLLGEDGEAIIDREVIRMF